MTMNNNKPKGRELMRQVFGSDQDFEWYPTTDAMLDIIKQDMESDSGSILDCGAGDGRALRYLTEGKKYAIEKSRPLLDSMDKDIFIVGTDFYEQTLIDKKVNTVFCNPPYSEYKQWAAKIIREANANTLYMIIPRRWKTDPDINEAIELRKAKFSVLASTDFLDAEREARAKVDIVKIALSSSCRHGVNPTVDPFTIWFDGYFDIQVGKTSTSDYEQSLQAKKSMEARLAGELVSGRDYIQVLQELYQHDMSELTGLYQSLSNVNPDILSELDVNLLSLMEGLRLKIVNLKDRYWNEFFNGFSQITDKLTVSKRQHIFDTLSRHTSIDFSVSNAYAVAIWVIKNANQYFDDQLIDTFELLVSKANVVNYKSNKRVFDDNQWRWHRDKVQHTQFGLELRIVAERLGGIESGPSWARTRHDNGLSSRASDVLNDLRVIADNLGFSVGDYPDTCGYTWESNRLVEFWCKDKWTRQEVVLMAVRAFKNGNLHIKFNQKFMRCFNVEFGRLKGWLKSPSEAASELNLTEEDAMTAFKTNTEAAILPSKLKLLANYST